MTLNHGYMAMVVYSVLGITFKFINRNLNFRLKLKYDYIHRWTVILCTFFLGITVFSAMLAGGRYSKGAAYSDLPFHLNLISSFAYGPNYVRKGFYEFDSPFYHGEKLAYPLMPDFLSAALITTGDASMQQSLFIPSALMMFSVIMSFFSISKYFLNDSWLACICILSFMVTGGLSFLNFFDPTTVWMRDDDSSNFFDFVHHWPNKFDAYWFQTLMHLLIPQRSSLFGVPLCYWTIFLLFNGVRKEEFKYFSIAAILTGFTPQIQAHAYMAMAQWCIAYCLVTFPYTDRKKWLKFFLYWLYFGVVANIMAFPQLPPYFRRMRNNRRVFLTFTHVWRVVFPGFWGFIKTWWVSLGTFGFSALIGGWATVKADQISMYIPGLVVFFISNFVQYQEWTHDNIKVFYDGWIPVAVPFAVQYMFSFYYRYKNGEKPKLNYFLFLSQFLMSIIAGSICIFMYLGSPSEIFEVEQERFGYWIAENTSPDSYFLGDESTEQPECSLGGRPVVMGYPGWIESHGLDFYGRNSFKSHLFGSGGRVESFLKENITHIYRGDRNKFDFDIWKEHERNWEIIYENVNITVFKIVSNYTLEEPKPTKSETGKEKDKHDEEPQYPTNFDDHDYPPDPHRRRYPDGDFNHDFPHDMDPNHHFPHGRHPQHDFPHRRSGEERFHDPGLNLQNDYHSGADPKEEGNEEKSKYNDHPSG